MAQTPPPPAPPLANPNIPMTLFPGSLMKKSGSAHENIPFMKFKGTFSPGYVFSGARFPLIPLRKPKWNRA